MSPNAPTSRPVIYWVTGMNSARMEQVAIFQNWLIKHGHPDMELRLDTANRDPSKMIIQGVSGVGGDTWDVFSGAGMRFFHSMGLLEPVTKQAKELNYGLDKTFPALVPELSIDGEQYMFPCNVTTNLYWVNKATFRKYGMEPPSGTWDIETFERMGKEFTKKSNPPGKRRSYFITNRVDAYVLGRSFGTSQFNETLTRSTLNARGYTKALELIYKWTYEDHILPTAADMDAFDSEAGEGGPELYLFDKGNYATFLKGRWVLIRLREQQEDRLLRNEPLMELDVVQSMYSEFPNAIIATRAAAVYAGSKHKDLAVYFQAFLASEDYNMQIVRDADALPPNPIYMDTEAYYKPLPLLPNLQLIFKYQPSETEKISAFRIQFYEALDQVDRDKPWSISDLPRPPKPQLASDAQYQKQLIAFDKQYNFTLPIYLNEWGLHEKFSKATTTISVPPENSPFVLSNVASRMTRKAYMAMMNHIITPQEAAQQAAKHVNAEIDRNLAEHPQLRERYEKLFADQQEIEALRKAGKKVPLHLIRNPFHQAYYRDQGWLKETP